jgi:hypothetical protein
MVSIPWDATAAIAAIVAAFLALFFGYNQLRARVSTHMGLGGTGNEMIWRSGEGFQTAVYVFNTGGTAAQNVRFKSWCKVMTKGQVTSRDAFEDGKPNPEHEGSAEVWPGIEVNLYYAVQSDALDADSKLRNAILSETDALLYVYGTIDYEDFLGFPHYKNFCVSYTVKLQSEYRWKNCPFHNDSN